MKTRYEDPKFFGKVSTPGVTFVDHKFRMDYTWIEFVFSLREAFNWSRKVLQGNVINRVIWSFQTVFMKIAAMCDVKLYSQHTY